MLSVKRNTPERRENELDSANQAVAQYLDALHPKRALLEVRAINKSAPLRERVRREYLSAEALIQEFPRLQKINLAGYDIYLGVASRNTERGTKDAVSEVHAVWADFDDVNPYRLAVRLEGRIAPPTVIVASSHQGAHCYWRLAEPLSVVSPEARERFEEMLQRFYADVGGDSVQDVSRLLRLPGTINWKSYHDSAGQPAACELLEAHPSRSYSIETFEKWFSEDRECKRADQATGHASLGLPDDQSSMNPPAYAPPPPGALRVARIIAENLDLPTRDRSRRDFAVLLEIVRVTEVTDAAELHKIVRSSSKFAEREAMGDQKYFLRTLRKVKEVLGISHER